MTGATQPFGRRGSLGRAVRRVQPRDDVIELAGRLPPLPDDRPAGVYTHMTDSDAQWAVEHSPFRPRARASPD